ncbi:hypothetical protein TNCV_4985351 [Trichonephila clavipes]|nr:hypothetical protein TNCV_4985351 [Trichonephila clavipes]
MRYRKSLTPQGGRLVEGEAERERNRSDVTRARVEECRKGAKSPKRVREAPKRSREEECSNFFSRDQNEKERSLQVELANATQQEEEAGASFCTDPSFNKWQRHLSVVRLF